MRGGALPCRAEPGLELENSVKILCVSCDGDQRRRIQSALESHWTTVPAADTATALAVARNVRPDLMVADVPRAGHAALFGALRKDPSTSGAPLLVLTERVNEEPQAGADDYVSKPFTNWELVSRVRLHLELRRLRSALDSACAPLAVAPQKLDATVRRVTENERRRARLFAILVRELRHPLSPIFLALDMLKKRNCREDDEITIIDRQAHKLSRLVNEVLELERLTSTDLEVETKRVDVASVVTRTLDATRVAITQRQHRLTVDLPDRPAYVAAEPLRLSQILVNLLDNAARYTDSGRLSLAVNVHGESVAFSVKDNGRGIAPDRIGRLFEPFERAPRDGDDRRGPGLGLAIVKVLVELVGGSAEARSEGLGKGSEFVVTLPAAK
jgi:signal transduction histidine kinase